MDSGNPEVWRWVWLSATVFFGLGEMAIAGSFFLGPFAIGAGVATGLAFLGVGLAAQWAAFVGVSVAMFLALRPLAKRLDKDGPILGIGSHRQIGQTARVVEGIDSSKDLGMVLLGSERWRAESTDGQLVPEGANVSVVQVRGTRLLVRYDPTAPGAGPARSDASST